MIAIDMHPLLDLRWCLTTWPQGLGKIAVPSWMDEVCAAGLDTDFCDPDDHHKMAVRDLLRHGGFKPAGRSKPCWEYIVKAAQLDRFPRINAAVDATNAAALHGALPVSTVDVERTEGELRVGIAPSGSNYVFNLSGQTIDIGGLLCLFDDCGPCANAVKDSQRTKTHDETTKTLTIVWGTKSLPDRAEQTMSWYREITKRLGGKNTG